MNTLQQGTGAQKLFFFTKLGSMLFVIVLAIYSLSSGMSSSIAKENFSGAFEGISFKTLGIISLSTLLLLTTRVLIIALSLTVTALGSGTISALWAYDGWSDVNAVAEEIKEPGEEASVNQSSQCANNNDT